MSLYHEARFWKGGWVGWLGFWNDFRLGGWVGVESFIRRRLYAHNWDTRFLHLGRVFCLFFFLVGILAGWPEVGLWVFFSFVSSSGWICKEFRRSGVYYGYLCRNREYIPIIIVYFFHLTTFQCATRSLSSRTKHHESIYLLHGVTRHHDRIK